MATRRYTVRINRAVGDVWDAVSNPDAIASWFPGVRSSVTRNNVRTVKGEAEDGSVGTVEDLIVTNDSATRRFQYRVVGAEGHLATVDVLEIASNDTLAIYSIELAAEDVANNWGPYVESGVKGLKNYLENAGQ